MRGNGEQAVSSPSVDVDGRADDDAVVELSLPAAEAPADRGLRAMDYGVEINEVDDALDELGVNPGDVIMQVGDRDARDLDPAEVDALLDRAVEKGTAIIWRDPNTGEIHTERLEP